MPDAGLGSEFTFEAKSVKNEDGKGDPYIVFRIPVPTDSKIQNERSAFLSSNDVKEHEFGLEFDIARCVATIRKPFQRYITRKIPHIEKQFNVRMSLKKMDDEYKLISSGKLAETSIKEMLNLCRRSNVYNFYLCFPLRGAHFHEKFLEFQEKVKAKIGSNVSFEKRPHITLALLNLVTDSDIDAIVRALQGTALAVVSLRKSDSLEPRFVDLSGLKAINYKGRAASRSVLFTNVNFDEYLLDVAKDFQESVNKAMNRILNEEIRNPPLKVKDCDLHRLTEAEAAAKGIYINKHGSVEINFTDVPTMDPNGLIDDQKLQMFLDSISKKDTTEHKTVKSPENAFIDNETRHCAELYDQSAAEHDSDGHKEREDEFLLQHDTSAPHEYHATLFRHKKVQSLTGIGFTSSAAITCVELRPRLSETCNFVSYGKGEVIKFVGNRFDNMENEEYGTTQISGSTAPDISQDLLTDLNISKTDNSNRRFVFWI